MATNQHENSVELLLEFTRSAHEAGYPANELETRVIELAEVLGLDSVQVSATPTIVNLTVGSILHQRVYVLRVQPHPVDLRVIGRLDKIAKEIASDAVDLRSAREAIEELHRHPLRRPHWLVVGAHSLASAGLAPILGGGWRESLGAAIVGLLVGIMTRAIMHRDRSSPLIAPGGAFLASFMAFALAYAGFDVAVADVTFASLFVLLPGMLMATGVREIATGHLLAGLANTANALVQLVGLVFGVSLGRSLATTWFGTIPMHIPEPFPREVQIIAAALVGLACVIILRAQASDAKWTCSAAVLAILAHLVATNFLGEIAGITAAAFVVGLAGNAVARQFYRSPLAFIVPGILLLVPGSIGYQSASSLFAGQIITGVDRAFDTFVAFLAIAYGLVASTLLLPDHSGKTRREFKADLE